MCLHGNGLCGASKGELRRKWGDRPTNLTKGEPAKFLVSRDYRDYNFRVPLGITAGWLVITKLS